MQCNCACVLSSADLFNIDVFKHSFQGYNQSVKQLGSRSGLTLCLGYQRTTIVVMSRRRVKCKLNNILNSLIPIMHVLANWLIFKERACVSNIMMFQVIAFYQTGYSP